MLIKRTDRVIPLKYPNLVDELAKEMSNPQEDYDGTIVPLIVIETNYQKLDIFYVTWDKFKDLSIQDKEKIIIEAIMKSKITDTNKVLSVFGMTKEEMIQLGYNF